MWEIGLPARLMRSVLPPQQASTAPICLLTCFLRTNCGQSGVGLLAAGPPCALFKTSEELRGLPASGHSFRKAGTGSTVRLYLPAADPVGSDKPEVGLTSKLIRVSRNLRSRRGRIERRRNRFWPSHRGLRRFFDKNSFCAVPWRGFRRNLLARLNC